LSKSAGSTLLQNSSERQQCGVPSGLVPHGGLLSVSHTQVHVLSVRWACVPRGQHIGRPVVGFVPHGGVPSGQAQCGGTAVELGVPKHFSPGGQQLSGVPGQHCCCGGQHVLLVQCV
jgi:hypothetical protein